MTVHSAAALLFDMDGTLIDSRLAVESIWALWCKRHGIALADVLRVSHGTRSEDTVRQLAPHLDLQAEVAWLEALEAEVVEGQVALPGAVSLLQSLPLQRWAVATSASRAVARMRFTHCGLPLPRVMVTADDVTHGKPDPEPYLQAAGRLGVEVRDCIVFEDAAAGLASALAAGCRVVLVGQHVPAQEGVIARIDDYRGVTWDEVTDVLHLPDGAVAA